MNLELIVEPEAEAEIDEASRWYEAQSPELGADFLRAVEEALAAVQRNPFQYQIVHGEVRRAGVRRFPYGLIYIASDREVIVTACFHGRRNPRRWRERT
jgi:plasmid stabilization system protein ParE